MSRDIFRRILDSEEEHRLAGNPDRTIRKVGFENYQRSRCMQAADEIVK